MSNSISALSENNQIKMIALDELKPFREHPFKYFPKEERDRMAESFKNVGILTPALARPLADGGYELVSGHRRKAVCEYLGIKEMPVIVRNMSDEEAVIAMVDANMQRDHLLPSERAFAYKMKLDAINHRGERTDLTLSQVGKKLNSYDEIAQQSGESKNQVYRYIRLTYLDRDLLAMVDEGSMALNPAVEISFLSEDEQFYLIDAMGLNDCTPSHAQAIRLKKLSQMGELTPEKIYSVMAETKPNQQSQIRLKQDVLGRFFPPSYTEEQIKKDIVKALELLKRQKDRNSR